MKKTKKKIYEVGGTIDNQGQQTGQNIGNLAGTALSLALPGIGSVLAPILGQVGSQIGGKIDMTKALQDHFNSLSQSSNPYGNYAHGGELGGQIKGGWDNLLVYQGDKHSAPSGGITVSNNGLPNVSGQHQVEDEETALRIGNETFIFSKALII